MIKITEYTNKSYIKYIDDALDQLYIDHNKDINFIELKGNGIQMSFESIDGSLFYVGISIPIKELPIEVAVKFNYNEELKNPYMVRYDAENNLLGYVINNKFNIDKNGNVLDTYEQNASGDHFYITQSNDSGYVNFYSYSKETLDDILESVYESKYSLDHDKKKKIRIESYLIQNIFKPTNHFFINYNESGCKYYVIGYIDTYEDIHDLSNDEDEVVDNSGVE